MDRPPLFEFAAVRLDTGGVRRLDGVDATIPDRGVTAVVGPSGAGKSSLLRCCNRLDVPSSGRVLFRGRDLAEIDPIGLRRRVGMVFQRPTPFPGTVLDNLAVAAPGIDPDAAAELMERARLDPALLRREADELSGGEAQRMCLARALATGPEALLMDEPTAALDAEPRHALEQLVASLATAGVPVVLVTHDLGQMERVADEVIVMIDRKVRHQSSRADLAHDLPADVERFLRGGSR